MFRRHYRTSLWLWLVCLLAACFGLVLIASLQRNGGYNYLRSQVIAAGRRSCLSADRMLCEA